ncbi:hypothetical protein HERIO_2089 [Hepatospora eriocheir]|uniref:Uncharacterized protein n=1 Tax=Hepatospora eriocheir TaxID=1081669 RepID=A0A1X0Q860_9MICR|nr:hypothetical protein HERIO_2089 [Hepatospora eriocheir]
MLKSLKDMLCDLRKKNVFYNEFLLTNIQLKQFEFLVEIFSLCNETNLKLQKLHLSFTDFYLDLIMNLKKLNL